MKFTETGIEDILIDLKPLDHAMEKANFIRAGQWDYERVTYDYKIGSPEKNITYYIRVQGYAIEGDVDRGDAVIKLLTPLLGKHYYPTGIEYGGDKEEFPETTIERAAKLLANARQNMEPFVKE
ncbi:phenylalanyl-tRNA synthetase alpha subunit [Gracilibacillus boraciitolerans JCM 21714]|uniref:Phenylalanyl-tRNA synthetase alpha subunit n=1 Tax=Gracilibacillus boraciitolerans JCM 21714 TaxID=1298598 RepID=W4VF14_9BACI|nr:YugN family protein [Gracilibacillus boraciitolerans]GAE91766.1 phenylalanyl-tRNA synthetase alpha subunit [Gracilibacillus boraciitolerans JCM 21714]